MKPSDAVLSIEGLRVHYDSGAGIIRALDGVDLCVRRGEVVGVVGESGSGKSTLAAAAMRLLPPAARMVGGRVMIAGRDIAGLSDEEMRLWRGGRVALVPQSAMNALNPVRTVGAQLVETIAMHSALRGTAARARARALLALVGIPPERLDAYPHQFSGGMRQRVVIAMAVACEPLLLIADEPTTGLDVLRQAELLALIGDLRDRMGMAVMLVSHDLAAVARLADRVCVMQHGLIVDTGRTDTLLSAPTHPYSRRLLAAIPSLSARLVAPATPHGNAPHGAGSHDAGSHDAASHDAAPHDAASHGAASHGRAPRGVAEDHRGAVDDTCLSRRRRAGDEAPRSLLQLINVSKSFGQHANDLKVLDGVSLSVCAGECVGLIGASGAGKSTIGRLAVGLTTADAGVVNVCGAPVSRRTRADRHHAARQTHLIFQDPYDSLAPGMRVRELVSEPCRIHRELRGAALQAAVHTSLEDVGLIPATRYVDAFPHELSGGERQRVALARAFILRPALIIADEPTSQLDAPLRADMITLIQRLGARHDTAFLYITHDLAIAGMVCNRLVILNEGRVVEMGPTDAVLTSPRDAFTLRLRDAALGYAPRD